jgi:hypothetical protein
MRGFSLHAIQTKPTTLFYSPGEVDGRMIDSIISRSDANARCRAQAFEEPFQVRTANHYRGW